MINIVNKRTHTPTPNDFYCGRGSPLGNPYDWRGSNLAEFKCSCREEAISNYKTYFDNLIKDKYEPVLNYLRRIYKAAKIGDVNLICYCAPLDCHTKWVKKFIERKLSENQK